MESERRSSKPDVAGSSPAGAISILDFRLVILDWKSKLKLFRGRLIERTLDFESGKKGLNPFPEAIFFISGRSADDYTDLFWEQVFAGLIPAARTNFSI